jgi:hypothetical protein
MGPRYFITGGEISMRACQISVVIPARTRLGIFCDVRGEISLQNPRSSVARGESQIFL